MKNKFLFTIILTSLCLLLFIVKTFAQEEHNTQTFKVSKGGTLRTEMSGGDILIKTGNSNEVKISNKDNDNYNNISIKHDGNNITIRSDEYIDFIITVPSEFNLNLNTSGGDIDVENNIKGNVRINTSGGDIIVKEVVGELTVNTSGGDIRCDNIKGNTKLTSSGGDIIVGAVDGECRINTGGGDIRVKEVSKGLFVSTGGGNIVTGRIGSDASIITGGGNIILNNVSGDLTVTTGGGNISCSGITKGAKITTGAGDIDLKNASGGIVVTSGAGNITAEIVSPGNSKSNIITGYGDINLYLPENSKATITAKVKWAEIWNDKKQISEYIKSDFKSTKENFDQERGEYYAVYELNGGGARIDVETSVGNINIKKLNR